MRWTKKAVERALAAGRTVGHGGWRPGAGRPRGRTKVAHEVREQFDPRRPVRVTLVAREDVPSLRRRGVSKIVEAAIEATSERGGFRVKRHEILSDRLVLVVESGSQDGLARAMQSLSVRIARRVNALFEREGTFFAERYRVEQAAPAGSGRRRRSSPAR